MGYFFIITTLLILSNSAHVIAGLFLRPNGTYFTGIAHYFADYFLYLSLMAQPSWISTQHLFTNESLAPTWIYWLYTILGKLGNPIIIYNVSIGVFTIIVLYLWWIIIDKVIPKQLALQRIALLFVATASNVPGFGNFWFSPMPALNRLGGVPHQLFQTILLLGVILLFTRRKFIACSIIAFLATTANPIQMLLVVIAITIVTMTSKKLRLSMYEKIVPLGLLGLAAFIGALVTNAAFARDPILSAAKTWENAQPVYVSLWQFILAVGPIAFLLPFGLKPFLTKSSSLTRILFCFSILSVLMFFSPLPSILGTSPIRWLSPGAYGVLPLIGAMGFMEISRRISLVSRQKIRAGIISYILLILYLLVTVPSIFNQIEARTQAPKLLTYVPLEVVSGLRAIQKPGVVLTDPTLPYDVLVPYFTHHPTFTGHPIHTLYPQTKEQLRSQFFEGAMTEIQANQFLSDHRISTILVSSRSLQTLPIYSFMKPIVQNEMITIYEVD